MKQWLQGLLDFLFNKQDIPEAGVTHSEIIQPKTFEELKEENPDSYEREKELRFEVLEIFTDGSCLRNGTDQAKGAWAWVCSKVPPGSVPESSSMPRLNTSEATASATGSGLLEPLVEGEVHTNNKAEFMAIIEALKFAAEIRARHVRICTDSQYVVDVLTGQKSAKVNVEYIQKIHDLIKKFQKVIFKWVPAHAGNKANQEADTLARKMLGLPVSGYRPQNRKGKTQAKPYSRPSNV